MGAMLLLYSKLVNNKQHFVFERPNILMDIEKPRKQKKSGLLGTKHLHSDKKWINQYKNRKGYKTASS